MLRAGPRWLTDEQQRAWRAYLRFGAALDEALDRQLQRDAGMPHAYYMVLAMLSEAPGRTRRMSELARITSSSPSRPSHAVARLEERGWVRRDKHPTDRRGASPCSPTPGSRRWRRPRPGTRLRSARRCSTGWTTTR